MSKVILIAAALATAFTFGAEVTLVAPVSATSDAVFVHPQSGEEVVINDFNYIIVSKADWYVMTNALNWLTRTVKGKYVRDVSTDAGRKAWHGSVVSSAITNGMKIVTYQDGFTWSEKMREFHNPITNRVKSASRPTPKSSLFDIPEGLRRIREERARQSKKVINGIFSAGGKFKEVK